MKYEDEGLRHSVSTLSKPEDGGARPWDTLPSIWDGWEKQFRCPSWLTDSIGIGPGEGGACALTFLSAVVDASARFTRIREAIVALYPESARYYMSPVVYANNELGWTPDQFRDLDRRLEWEYQQAQLGRQIDAIPIESPDRESAETVPAGA